MLVQALVSGRAEKSVYRRWTFQNHLWQTDSKFQLNILNFDPCSPLFLSILQFLEWAHTFLEPFLHWSLLWGSRPIILYSQGLPFLPLDQLNEAFAEVRYELEFYDNERIEKFLDYVERQWISDNGIFPRSMWSHINNDGARTTNCVEGYHHKLNQAVRHHPDIFTLIDKLKEFNDRDEFNLRQVKMGRIIKSENLNYKRNDKKIQDLRNKFSLGSITRNEFLDALKHSLAWSLDPLASM